MSGRDFKETLFGSIDAENIDGTIRQLAKAWYFVAALQAALQIFLVWVSAAVSANLVDPLICALGGYVLGARKSRAVAVLLFIYALAVGAMTLAARGGATSGGTNIVLALVVVVVGWRSVQAAWMYHKLNGLRTAWKHVVAISSLAAVVSVIMFAAVVLSQVWMPQYMGNGTLTFLIEVATILLSVLAVMWALTRRYQFACSEMLGGRNSREIPAVFD